MAASPLLIVLFISERHSILGKAEKILQERKNNNIKNSVLYKIQTVQLVWSRAKNHDKL